MNYIEHINRQISLSCVSLHQEDANESKQNSALAPRSDRDHGCNRLRHRREIRSQLGNGTTTNAATPVTASGLSGVSTISLGASFGCAVTAIGSVSCWGANFYGRLGTGSTSDSVTSPQPVPGLTNVSAVAAGGDSGNHTCALLADGTVKCWGSNYLGQLGNGLTSDSNIPVSVLAG